MRSQPPLIIYHRGRHGNDIRVKENTLKAFTRAIKEGARMIEFDVLAGLRVAHDLDPTALAAPTLREVMDLIRARCAVNIEIKTPQAMREVMMVVGDALALGPWTPEQIVVSSFHHHTAILVKQQFPEIRVGVIAVGVLESVYIDWLARQGVDNLHLAWESVFMDMEDGCQMRAALRANGMHIWVYTVNTKEIFDTVIEYGAEAVFTDKPNLFR